jgi:hypothetical protein
VGQPVGEPVGEPGRARPVVVVDAGAAGPGGDVLVSGRDRAPRRLPRRIGVGLAAAAVLAAGLAALATGAGRPEAVPPPPLAALGPATARLDAGRLLVQVEAELRTREPVVLRRGLVTGDSFVVLVDPRPMPTPQAPDAVTSRIVALVDPACSAAEPPFATEQPVLQVVVAPQAGGEAVTLRSDVPQRALTSAARTACAPVQASATLPPGSGAAAEAVLVTVRVQDPTVPVRLLSLAGRGFQLDAAQLAGQLAAATGGPPFAVTASVPVVVSDCVVEVQAPRRLVLHVERGDDPVQVPVTLDRPTIAGLDELVRTTCRRARG